MIKEYVYCVKNPMDGSTSCKNPKVIFITGEGQAVPCPENGDGCITITIPDGVNGCVTGEIICEDCGKCPPKPFTICPCDTSADCDQCEKCENGVCVKICDGLCNNGDCVECIYNTDCILGKVCKDGTCQCPAGKNFINERGECVECLSGAQCGKCEVCLQGTCVGKACDASCDPATGDCVECLNSGHCQGRSDGRNCCKGVTCDCCEGYIYNIALNTCVPKPDCILDSDCNSCDICVAGGCQPRVCPDGTICINDKCVEICDCNNPTCDRTSSCVRYNSTTCICSKCEGTCSDSSQCGEGCYCNGGNCVPNPCNKPCLSGADCGPNCGCKDNTCIPCDSLNCANEDCANVDGCKCYGSTCQGDPCSGPCENGSDCGQGCGCKDGNCVSCDKLSCDECASTLGCKCTNDKCVAVPKCNGVCTSSADCGPGCTCYEGNCVSCSSFACNECFNSEDCNCVGGKCEGLDKTCSQTFALTKEECTLKASLSKAQCCNCAELEVKTELTEIRTTTSTILQVPAKDYVFTATLYKGGLPLEAIDFPLFGTIKGEAKYYYIIDGVQYSGSTSSTGSFNGATNKLTFTFTLPSKGYDPKVLSYSFHFTQKTNIELPNQCTYRANNNTLTFKQYDKLNVGLNESGFIKSKDCRAPLFTWYRGTSINNVSEKVHEVYANDGGTYWFNYISDCTEGFCSGYYYSAKTDCGCVSDTLPLQALVCPTDLTGDYNMDKFDYTITNCGTKFTLTDIFNNCPLNGLLNPSCTKCPVSSQVKWILKLYDASGVVDNREFKYNLGSEVIGYTFTSSTPLTKVTLESSQDPNCKYSRTLTPGIPVEVTYDCDTLIMSVATGGDAPIAGCTVELYLSEVSGSPIATTTTNVNGIATIAGMIPNTLYVVKTTCSSCVNETPVTINCCTSGGTDLINPIFNPSTENITVSVLPGASGNVYKYYIDNVLAHTGTSSEVFSNPLANGIYAVKSIDNYGCTAGPINMEVDNCPAVTISIAATYDSTIGTEKVNVTAILGNGLSPYDVKLLNPSNVTVKEQTGVATYPLVFNVNDLADGTYTIKATCANGCIGTTSIVLQKGLACSLNPADINASRPHPSNNSDCAPNVQTKLWINNANAPYTVKSYKDGVIVSTENFIALGDSSSGNILYGATIALNDEYEVSDLPDGLWKFEVTDNRGCTDFVEVNVACTCLVPINLDTQGIVCNGTSHKLVINSVTGGQYPGVYNLKVYEGGDCSVTGLLFIDAAIGSGAVEIPIPAVNQQAAGDQYSVVITSGICETTCITLNSPDCSAVECITDVEAYHRGEIDCAGDPNTGFAKVKLINNSAIPLDYEVWRKASTIVSACPDGINCSTVGYTSVGTGSIAASGGVACIDTIDTDPDGTMCFMAVFSNPADPACQDKCFKTLLNFTI